MRPTPGGSHTLRPRWYVSVSCKKRSVVILNDVYELIERSNRRGVIIILRERCGLVRNPGPMAGQALALLLRQLGLACQASIALLMYNIQRLLDIIIRLVHPDHTNISSLVCQLQQKQCSDALLKRVQAGVKTEVQA